MKNKVFGIVTFAVLIEGIISYIQQFFVYGSFYWEMLDSGCNSGGYVQVRFARAV